LQHRVKALTALPAAPADERARQAWLDEIGRSLPAARSR
jgi:hypothetical protein